jgi:SMP-30/Gluconolactonase/LRE-like region
MISSARIQRFAAFSLLVLFAGFSLPARQQEAQPRTGQQEEELRGAPAEPDDAAEVRAQIAVVARLLPNFVDRGAALYFLAAAKQHLGESREAFDLLKECMALDEGFDPSGGPEFTGLRGEHSFTELVERARQHFPAVAMARLALATEEKDLVPEGLAWDPKRELFYLSSLHRKKIVQITPDSHTSDFVPPQQDPLLPVLGIRLDPNDGTVWANAFQDAGASAGTTQLLHIDTQGKVLARFSPPDKAHHGFNDLVVLKSGEVFTTDSPGNAVFRFDPRARKFTTLQFHRPLFYPNGIALAGDDRTIYVADTLGVIKYDLANSSSTDVAPGPHATLAGVDGLYWHRGSLVAIQNGIGTPRVAAFKLSPDGRRVARVTILEYRTTLTALPTTGAIRGSDFYFISNSQIDNLNGDKILDPTRLEPVRIAVVHLP